jgi:diguanylate cyclase (GGDEF)-like protein
LRLLLVVAGRGEAYRYGGEEFAAILPNHSAEEALAVAERLRRLVEASPAPAIRVTSSFGVATVPTHAIAAVDWVKRSDEALYDAKRFGRNVVRLYGEPAPEAVGRLAPRRNERSCDVVSGETKEQ